MDTRRWTLTLALAAVLVVVFTVPTSDATREHPAPDRPSIEEVGARVDTLAAVVADMRAVRWMFCRSDDMPRHQRCEVGDMVERRDEGR